MAKLFRRGRIWWAWIRGERKSTKCTDKKAAELAARELERRAADPSYAAAHETTLDSALADFVDQQRERGKAPETVKMHECHAGHLVRLLGAERSVQSVDAAAVDHFLAERTKEGAKRSTLGKELSTLRGTLRMAARRGSFLRSLESVMPHNFAIQYTPGTRALTLPEVHRLMAALEPERAAVCAYIVATAADWRSVETAAPGDFDRKNGSVLVRGTKNANRWRVVPVLKVFGAMLRKAWPSVPFRSWGNVRRDLAVACRAAGVQVVTPRDLRRSCGSILRARHVEPHLIAKIMGHADSRMVERVYSPITAAELGAMIDHRTNTAQRKPRTTKKPRQKRRKSAA